jgi:hypothetical protein
MDIDRAIELFAIDIERARPGRVAPVEPVVQIPVSVARLYLEAMREANEIIETVEVTELPEGA